MITTRNQDLSPLAFSLNDGARNLVDRLEQAADALGVRVHRYDDGARVIDAGVDVPGSLEAGVSVAEICMAGLGHVDLVANQRFKGWLFDVNVRVSQAVITCLGSQYAGWSLSAARDDDPAKTWRGMASGPARALSLKEEIFDDLGFRDGPSAGAPGAVLVIEADRLPPQSLTRKIAEDCGVDPREVSLLVTPTGSFAGVVQIAARVVEVALHKAHTVGFDLGTVSDGIGTTPLPPPSADGLTAMGRTNDTILFGGCVHLFVNCDDADAKHLAQALPSSNSKDYGKPFAEVFKQYDYDFFKIDPELFSPAEARVTNIASGNTFESGRTDEDLLLRSFSSEYV